MAIDLDRVRADTPAATALVHLNNAGAALSPTPVVDRVVDHLRLEAEVGGYEAAALVADELAQLPSDLGALVGESDGSAIALVDSATRGWLQVAHGIDWRRGDRALVCRSEYGSNVIALLQLGQAFGVEVEVVPDDEHGQIDLEALESMLDERVRLVALTHAPTQGGLVNPAEGVGQVLRRTGSEALYLLDACQSVGQLELDVARIGCDALSATGRKFLRAPRGTGFLWVGDRALARLAPPWLDLRSADWVADDRIELAAGAQRFELWERPAAGLLGLGVAARYALDLGIAAVEERVVALASGLRARLSAVPGVAVHDRGVRLSGICTFTADGAAPGEVVAGLSRRRVNVNVSTLSSARYDLGPRALPELVRASVHYYLRDEDLDRAVEALVEVLGELRR